MENGAISPDCNSFNAEYSKRGTEDTKYLSTTGAEYGSRGARSSRLSETQHQLAFTLAEVLITLSIIGVVAALTIPGLVVKNQEKQAIVQLKKAYNVFSNAFALSEVEYGKINTLPQASSNIEGAISIMNRLSPFLSLLKRCDGTTGCWSQKYKTMNGTTASFDALGDRSKGILADGMIFNVWYNSGTCTWNYGEGKYAHGCGIIEVDVNAEKKPNIIGKDIFSLKITQNGIVPSGGEGDTRNPLKSDCMGASGWGCAMWAILNQNTNYPPSGTGWDN